MSHLLTALEPLVPAGMVGGMVGGVAAVLGGWVGVLVRRLVLTGAHRRPGDPALRDPRRLPVALGLGWLGVVVALRAQPPGVVVAYLVALSVGAWLMAVDADVQRLPNAVTLPAVPVSVVALAACSALARDPPAWGRALLGGLLLGGAYLVLYLFGAWRGAAGIGLGDVKLALTLGPWLAWLGWPVLLAGAYVGFVLSGLGALALLALGRAGPGTALPHGPSMIVGAWLGWCAAPLL